MLRPYHNVSSAVLKDIYRNYYRFVPIFKPLVYSLYFSDFVYFNYTIDEALAIARNYDSEEIILKRRINRNKMKAKYLPREVNTNEDACEPNFHDFGFL